MPTYRVTDPATGRSVRLTGDTPPTEQELEDVFKSLGPADVAAPVAASAPSTAPSPLLAWNGITGSLIPEETQLRAASAIAGSQQAPLNPQTSQLPLLGPILDLARAVGEAGPDVARGLVNEPMATLRGGAAGAVEGLADLASPLNIALQATPYLRNLLRSRGAVPPPALAARTGTGALPVEPVPASGGFSGPTATSPGLPGPVRPPIPLEAVATGTGARPAAGIPAAGGFSRPPVPAAPAVPAIAAKTGTAAVPVEAVPAGGASAVRSGTGGFSMRVPARPEMPAAESFTPTNQAPLPKMPVRVLPESSATAVVDDVVKSTTEAAHAGTPPVELVKQAETKIRLSVPELVRRMRDEYGSARAGDMLFGNTAKAGKDVLPRAERAAAVKRLAPGESKVPNIVKNYKHGAAADIGGDDIASQLKASLASRLGSEKGAVNPLLAAQAGGAVIGGAAGAASGDDAEDSIVRGIIGAGLGAAAPLAIARVASHGLEKTAQDAIYTTTLSSPTSVAKAYLGAIGGAVSAAAEMSVDNPQGAQRILTALFSRQSVGEFTRAFKTNSSGTGMAANAPTIVGRFFNAGDAVAKRAMAAGGIAPEDAARFTLAGLPTTELGQGVLKLWNQHLLLRLGTTLFPRVGVQVIERGLERTPGLGAGLIKGIGEGASRSTKTIRQVGGAAGALAGYEFADQIPDSWKPWLVPLAGPYALPVAMGLGAGTAKSRGKEGASQVKAALGEAARNMPFPQYGPMENLMQHATGSSLIPAAMRDVAVAADPYERDTSGSMFDRAKAKIPGIRETLPVRGRKVNIAGEPLVDRSTPLSRVMNPAPSQNEPFKGIPDSVKREIQRLDIRLNPPSFEKKVKVGQKEVAVPPEAAERLQRQRREFLVPAIEKLVASPSYQSASDEVKKRRLNAAIQQAEERGAAKARSTVAEILRGSRGKR